MKLDDREQAVLLLLSNEETPDEIAVKLNLRPGQIDQIVKDMFDKFQVRSEIGLVKKAIKLKILDNS